MLDKKKLLQVVKHYNDELTYALINHIHLFRCAYVQEKTI